MRLANWKLVEKWRRPNYFYQTDHLNTPMKMTASAGKLAWQAHYDAFGKAVVDVTKDVMTQEISTVENNLRFPGQYFDKESNLHYNYHRYYDPGTGRYVSADPIGFGGRDVNWYRYADNNSLMYVDSSGLAKSYSDCVQQCVGAFKLFWSSLVGGAFATTAGTLMKRHKVGGQAGEYVAITLNSIAVFVAFIDTVIGIACAATCAITCVIYGEPTTPVGG